MCDTGYVRDTLCDRECDSTLQGCCGLVTQKHPTKLSFYTKNKTKMYDIYTSFLKN